MTEEEQAKIEGLEVKNDGPREVYTYTGGSVLHNTFTEFSPPKAPRRIIITLPDKGDAYQLETLGFDGGYGSSNEGYCSLHRTVRRVKELLRGDESKS